MRSYVAEKHHLLEFPYGIVNSLAHAPAFSMASVATRMEGSFIHIPWRPFGVAFFLAARSGWVGNI
jgi:hypothetical protein